MNQHDKDNLSFIMNSTPDQLADWIIQADEDDIKYAFELINRAAAELETQALEMMDDVDDLTEANNIINMIKDK